MALVAYLAGRLPVGRSATLARVLDARWVVVAVFVTTFLVLLWVWGSRNPIPVIQDELAYVLQAQIFARGRWALPQPALPLFFEQPYVLVQPTLASKYFPGHSILLTIGALAGWMPLVPLVLQSSAAALLVVLSRRVANGAVALLAWVLWLSSPMVLHFGPSYFSESTTIVCWLGGWYALLRWREERRRHWLVAVAVFTGWCVLTRPLTGLAYAIPVGIVVLRDVLHGRRWRDFSLAMAAGGVVLALIPLWSVRTTGDWRVTPLAQYTRDYMPFDLPGFGVITTPPARALNPQFAHLDTVFRAMHPGHVPAALPGISLVRAVNLAHSVWGGARALYPVLVLCALAGLVTLRGPAAFAVASGVLLFVTYLSFGTAPSWTLYYYESVPAYAYLTAAGIGWMAHVVGARRLPRSDQRLEWRAARWTPAVVAAAILLTFPGAATAGANRRALAHQRTTMVLFARLRASIPGRRVVLFVRHASWHKPEETFVQNVPDPEMARLLVVHDRGDEENRRLLALMPDRSPVLFDEARSVAGPYDPQPNH